VEQRTYPTLILQYLLEMSVNIISEVKKYCNRVLFIFANISKLFYVLYDTEIDKTYLLS
jgi:hypothetical protein